VQQPVVANNSARLLFLALVLPADWHCPHMQRPGYYLGSVGVHSECWWLTLGEKTLSAALTLRQCRCRWVAPSPFVKLLPITASSVHSYSLTCQSVCLRSDRLMVHALRKSLLCDTTMQYSTVHCSTWLRGTPQRATREPPHGLVGDLA